LITVIDEQVFLYPKFLKTQAADHYFRVLYEDIDWQQEQLFLYGRQVNVPRLIAWHGDDEVNYRYSGVDHMALPWSQPLSEIREMLSDQLAATFNGVLLNLYRDGQDSMGWHSDDEPELGIEPVIASVSLGQERNFQFRRRDNHAEKVSLILPHGSLLVIQGGSQQIWQHQMPKSSRAMKPRINLTFRNIGI
jgi:alkylated DNA repair dioxygenase AlkB